MLVRMTRLRIVGRRERADETLRALHRLGRVQLDRAPEIARLGVEPMPRDPLHDDRANELRLLLARLDGLLALAPGRTLAPDDDEADPSAIRASLDAVAPRVVSLATELDALRAEQAALPRYLDSLRTLVPLAPELASLDDKQLRMLGLETVALLLDGRDMAIVDALRTELADSLGGRFTLVGGRVDADSIGCILVVGVRDAAVVHALLGREHVLHVPLPSGYESRSLFTAVQQMQERLDDLPDAVSAAEARLGDEAAGHAAAWARDRLAAAAQLERLEALELLGVTRSSFVLVCWVPREQVAGVREALGRELGPELLVEELPVRRGDAREPVLLRNAAPVRPFEGLVGFLSLPSPGSLDPSALMALFLPLLLGVMVGDVGYGIGMLAIACVLRRKLDGLGRDIGSVLLVGALWSIVFGVLFGEFLGSIGRELGMPALWFYRGGPEALEPLLLFAIALGGAHIGLGLLLGIWHAVRMRAPRTALDRGGTLTVLGALFALGGVATGALPQGAVTPAVAAAICGTVLVLSLHGPLGLLIGPIELLGRIGNVLSYLRIAAIGVASVYLANVANELYAAAPLALGVTVAAFFHALNLALAAFSPTIQALRLHYVEFFSQFHEGGGHAFRPFGRNLPTPTRRSS